MTTVAYLISGVLGLFGLLFLIGSTQGHTGLRIVFGLVLLGAAGALFYLGRMKAPQPTLIQKIDLTGDVAAQDLKCKSCGGKLDSSSVTVEAGAVFIKCPYCGAQYQLEEAPKW